jgi:hypothetical protein
MIECIAQRWTPGIGDPTLVGWLTVLVYLAAAAATFRQTRINVSRNVDAPVSLNTFWLGLSVLLLALAVNKQLDLQSALTAAGRCLAQAQGWYDGRRSVQAVFIAMVAITGLAAFAGAVAIVGKHARELWVTLAGVALLLTFVVSRAAGFHHMDALINDRLFGLKVNWMFEIGALAIIMIGLPRRRRDQQSDAPAL